MADINQALARRGFEDQTVSGLKVVIFRSDSDAETARNLASFFGMVGIESWIPEEDLLPGQNSAVQTRKQVRRAHFILVLLSREAVAKAGTFHAQIGWALAAQAEMPGGAIKLVPCLLEECEIPYNLKQLVNIRFYEPGGWNKLATSFHHEWERRKAAGDI